MKRFDFKVFVILLLTFLVILVTCENIFLKQELLSAEDEVLTKSLQNRQYQTQVNLLESFNEFYREMLLEELNRDVGEYIEIW